MNLTRVSGSKGRLKIVGAHPVRVCSEGAVIKMTRQFHWSRVRKAIKTRFRKKINRNPIQSYTLTGKQQWKWLQIIRTDGLKPKLLFLKAAENHDALNEEQLWYCSALWQHLRVHSSRRKTVDRTGGVEVTSRCVCVCVCVLIPCLCGPTTHWWPISRRHFHSEGPRLAPKTFPFKV